MRKRMMLQLFEDGSGAGSGGQGGNAGNGNGGGESAGSTSGASNSGTYTYEQLEEIASARASKSERAALASFFRGQGMTEAITKFKTERAANQPDTAKLQKERDDALKEVQQMKNEKFLSGKGVKTEDLDYVMFKVSKLVNDKTTFEKAAEQYLKENPKYTGSGTYRVSTSSGSSSEGAGGSMNASINERIRAAARK